MSPLPFTKRERRAMSTQYGYGHRPTNDWNEGDLPAPFAEGDIVEMFDPSLSRERARGMGIGFYVVSCVFSIDEGDAWYCRVTNPDHRGSSDRLHIAYADRSTWHDDVNWMAGFRLYDSADPDGLAERERLIAAGWSFEDRWETCPTCGNTRPSASGRTP